MALLAASPMVGEAGAAPLPAGCGQVITTDTVLQRDIGPCPNNGLVVAADNVTVDLNGHSVFGTGKTGDGAGVLVSQRTGVVVRNGSVRLFDAGVAVEGGTGNSVIGVTAVENIGGSGAKYGDGIALLSSTNNLVEGNTALRNGPFSGIGLYELIDSDHPRTLGGPSFGNVVRGNTIRANNECRTPQGSCDNDGIRVEPGVQFTLVEGNYVAQSGLDGISLFRTADDNTVRGNTVEYNGHHRAAHRKGDGIRVFSNRNLVEDNSSFYNANHGIVLGFRRPNGTVLPATDNQILSNDTGFNLGFDLHDVNPGCDNNTWSGNTYRTADPACTTG